MAQPLRLRLTENGRKADVSKTGSEATARTDHIGAAALPCPRTPDVPETTRKGAMKNNSKEGKT